MMVSQLFQVRSSPAVLLAGAAGLAIIGLADCTAMQALRGEFDAGRTALWTMATLVPLTIAAVVVAALPRWRFDKPSVAKIAGATFLLLAVLVVVDALVFPGATAAEGLDRARSKLPGAAAFVALGLAANGWRRQRVDALEAGSAPAWLAEADTAAISEARLVRAAGNYIEVHSPVGRMRLVRLRIGQVAELPQASGLVRLHRSLLVRASAVAGWRNDRSGLVAALLDDGTEIGIGRKYRGAAYRLRDSCRSSPSA